MTKDTETKKRKASVPADLSAKMKKAKKAVADVKEPANKRKAIEDAAPVKVKKSKLPKTSLNGEISFDEAPMLNSANNNATLPIVVPVKEPKKSKDSAAKKLKAKDTTESESKSSKSKSKIAADITYSSEEDEAEEKEDSEAVEDDDQTEAFLKGFESDEDEAEEVSKPITDVGEVPTLNKKLKKQAKKATEAAADEKPGVVYIGRIPHGFYENEMRAYFKQFGNILSLRLARNRKTGASKHIAWIKFESSTVADIVAKTMDNYILFGHILKVKTIPDEQVPENLFKGANKRFKKVPWNKIAGRRLEQGASETIWDKRIEKEEERRKAKADQMKEIGYNFESPKIKSTKNIAKTDKKSIITANSEADEAEELKTIEAPPAAKESSMAKKKKAKKVKESEIPIVPATHISEPKGDAHIVEEAAKTIAEVSEKKLEKKLKKKKSETTLVEKTAALAAELKDVPVIEEAAEVTAEVSEKKLKKKKSKTVLVENAAALKGAVNEEPKKSKKSKKEKEEKAAL